MKIFRFLSKIVERFLLNFGIDIRPPTSVYWGKELRVPSDSEYRGMLRRDSKEKKERENFISAPLYRK